MKTIGQYQEFDYGSFANEQFAKNNCLQVFFKFIQTQKRYISSLNKISILTPESYLLYQAKFFL